MTLKYVLGLGPHGFHRLGYREWGDQESRSVLLCVHGLTRTSADFESVALALGRDYRIVAPDLPGRGCSDWLADKADYNYSVYLHDVVALLARLDVEQIDWVGTSLGGILGMLVAAQSRTPIRRLLLNDIGPFVPQAALERIALYVGEDVRFTGLDDLERYVRRMYAGFGPLTDAHWRHIALHSGRRLASGEYRLHYDPAIGQAVRDQADHPIDLWATWDAIRCPVRVVRGERSDVLPVDVAAEMQVRGPKAEVLEWPGCGHAPALMAADQIEMIRQWVSTSSSK